ncbi:MAG: GntR family transcriptional regulator [Acidobacteriota bacterium]|jgi:DNA-binding GntR family transcriptional regulator
MSDSEPSPAPKQRAEWIAERLRHDIQEGRLRPGDWIRQEHVAQRLGVSQIPVREALKQLVAEGLLEHEPFRGARVITFSVEDVEDLYAARAAVEGRAARFAALRITEAELRALTTLHERMMRCQTPRDLRQYRELNRMFHLGVIEASRRPYLVRCLRQLWIAFPTMGWSSIPQVATTSTPARDGADDAEHAGILEALAARDGERAEAVTRVHIESAAAALVAAMR